MGRSTFSAVDKLFRDFSDPFLMRDPTKYDDTMINRGEVLFSLISYRRRREDIMGATE